MFGLSVPLSQKIILAPRKTKALTVDTNVNEGAITSSPCFIFNNMAAISRASVQDVVNNTFFNPYFFSKKS